MGFKKKVSSRIVSFVVSILILVFAIGFYTFAQWTDPISAPPNDNVATPINTGNVGQIKVGGLTLNYGNGTPGSGAINALLIPNGKVGIGVANPSGLLDLSDGVNTISFTNGTYVIYGQSGAFWMDNSGQGYFQSNVIIDGNVYIDGGMEIRGGLLDSLGNLSVDSTGRALYDYTGVYPRLDWYHLILIDDSNADSIRWGNRELNDSSEAISVYWGNRQLYANDGSDVILNWSTPGTADFQDNDIVTTGNITANNFPGGGGGGPGYFTDGINEVYLADNGYAIDALGNVKIDGGLTVTDDVAMVAQIQSTGSSALLRVASDTGNTGPGKNAEIRFAINGIDQMVMGINDNQGDDFQILGGTALGSSAGMTLDVSTNNFGFGIATPLAKVEIEIANNAI
ncbi:MAG: hypothetical protein ABH956_00040, partial [Candidatus Nealsonbacteria bacterium]